MLLSIPGLTHQRSRERPGLLLISSTPNLGVSNEAGVHECDEGSSQFCCSALCERDARHLGQEPERAWRRCQFVGHHDPGLAELRDQRARETSGRFCIPARLNLDIEHVFITVNCPPEPVFCPANDGSPSYSVATWRLALAGPGECRRKVSGKPVNPFADRFPAGTNPPLRREIFNSYQAWT